MKDIRGAPRRPAHCALRCGRSGKAVMLRQLQRLLEEEKKITVSKSLAIDKHRIKLATFIAALFYDLSTEIQWLPTTGTDGQSETDPMLTDDALELLVAKLRTPLQIQLHLILALEAGYQAGERPVPVEVVESVLSRHILDSCR